MNDDISRNVSSDDKNLALLAHLLGIIPIFIPPLLIWLSNKEKPEKAFLNDQAREALNFQITVFIVMFSVSILIGILLLIPVLGWFLAIALGILLFLIWVVDVVFCVLAAIAVNKGGRYHYPIALRLIS
ncbi:MAG: DUF4870 domain-containing protein [Zoogloeaceae bacterium]|nr:DUF4870 domain-containing protein [Zoogloeaceae bacterium]